MGFKGREIPFLTLRRALCFDGRDYSTSRGAL